MTKKKAIELLRGGKNGVAEWNRWRERGKRIPDLSGADLSGTDLSGAILSYANLSGAVLSCAYLFGADLFGALLENAYLPKGNLSHANLENANLANANLSHANLENACLLCANFSGAKLSDASLSHANFENAGLVDASLSRANLSHANLFSAKLQRANLSHAILCGAHFSHADLTDANLSRAKLSHADLSRAKLSDADLAYADLQDTNLSGANVDRTDLNDARLIDTVIANVDLSAVRGLDRVLHHGPSSVSTSTLVASKGRIPDEFLRGCGLQPWEALAAKLYDPALTPAQINDLQYRIFDLRASSPVFLGGVFISYSDEDSPFVDKIRTSLMDKGANVWLDRHDLVAGPLQEQVDRALRLHDVVLLVLSKAAIESPWVEHELEMALKKEKDEARDVLCPVALDDSWKAKMDDVLWGQVKKKKVLDFAKWNTKAFSAPFQKLLKGLKIYYAPKAQAGDPDAGRAT